MPDGSAVIASKLANALIADAQPVMAARVLSGNVLGFFSRLYGGLWVGGRVTLTRQQLTFEPNAMNRSLHENVDAASIPLQRVTHVSDRFGVLTRIIDVKLDDGSVFTFRCFGAPELARQIADAAKRAR